MAMDLVPMHEAARTLEEVGCLRTAIERQADAMDTARRVPPELVDDLERAGCFRLFGPHAAPDYSGALRVIESLAHADGSVGWTVSQAALGQIILGYLCHEARTTIYAHGSDLRVAGVFAPKGHATRSDTGWLVSGRWPFASGCQHASWIYAQCLVVQDRRIQRAADATPFTRMAVFLADDVAILDMWACGGLRRTGSHDLELKNQPCPDAWTCALGEVDGTGAGLQSLPLMDVAGLLLGAVAVGIAAGALADLAAVARSGRRPAFSPRRLAEDPVFHDRLAEAHMRYRAARALLYSQGALVDVALEGSPLSPVDRASLHASCHHVTALTIEAVDACFTLGRSASVPRLAPLQRRWRDLHPAMQHAWNSRAASDRLGAALGSGGPAVRATPARRAGDPSPCSI